jgi:hypothetical protein
VERIDLILGEIRRIWYAHPDLRLGQLVENAVDPGETEHYTESMYWVEDSSLLAGLLNYPKEN